MWTFFSKTHEKPHSLVVVVIVAVLVGRVVDVYDCVEQDQLEHDEGRDGEAVMAKLAADVDVAILLLLLGQYGPVQGGTLTANLTIVIHPVNHANLASNTRPVMRGTKKKIVENVFMMLLLCCFLL